MSRPRTRWLLAAAALGWVVALVWRRPSQITLDGWSKVEGASTGSTSTTPFPQAVEKPGDRGSI